MGGGGGGGELEEEGECMNRCVHVHPSKMKRYTPCPTWHPKIWAHWQYIIISRPPHACTLLFNRDVRYGSLIPSELQSAGGQDFKRSTRLYYVKHSVGTRLGRTCTTPPSIFNIQFFSANWIAVGEEGIV